MRKSSARWKSCCGPSAEPDVYSYVNKEQCEELVDFPLVHGRRGSDKSPRRSESRWRPGGQSAAATRAGSTCAATNTASPQLMEINPLAGLHPTHSDLPMLWTAIGRDYVELIERIVESAKLRISDCGLRIRTSQSAIRNPQSAILTSMRVAFLYNRAAEDPAQFAEDDDPSRSPVVAALRRLGHDVTPIACTLDLGSVRRQLEQVEPDVVFNRVESLGGSDAMAVAVPCCSTRCRFPTPVATRRRSSPTARQDQRERTARSRRSADAGVDHEDFELRNADCGFRSCEYSAIRQFANPQFILKSIYEHASFEMDDACRRRPSRLRRNRRARPQAHVRMTGKPFFAERFVEGREFNLSLLGDPPEVLPPAEIDFSAFPADKPRIVGFGAKWAEASFEFQNTPRRFDFPAADAPLIRWLKDLAIECWRLFWFARLCPRRFPRGCGRPAVDSRNQHESLHRADVRLRRGHGASRPDATTTASSGLSRLHCSVSPSAANASHVRMPADAVRLAHRTA